MSIDWLEHTLRAINLETRRPAEELAATPRPTSIDLRTTRFIDLLNLINLFLLTDLCQSLLGPVSLELPGIGQDEALPLDPGQFASFRKTGKKARSLSPIEGLYESSHQIYRFLGFLKHFGLFESLADSRGERRVLIPGLSKKVLESLMDYSAIQEVGSCVVPLTPIRSPNDVAIFKSRRRIDDWVARLPQDFARSPLFSDGEFSELLGHQLAENIVQHAFVKNAFDPASPFYDTIGKDELPSWGYMGAIAMRVIRSDVIVTLRDAFPHEFVATLEKGRELGMLELVVGDRGVGIAGSLGPTVEAARSALGLSTSTEDCIAFALHPLGSRKKLSSHSGGAHALHRVVNCVAKYGGSLRILTGQKQFLYTAEDLDHQLGDVTEPLGIHTKAVADCTHPLGVQLQLLIPLTAPDKPRMALFHGGLVARLAKEESTIRVIAAGIYAGQRGAELLQRETSATHLIGLANALLEEPLSTTIFYDFGSSDYDWESQSFIGFLESQEKVLHNHLCVGINLGDAIARQLREHELLDPVNPPLPLQKSGLLEDAGPAGLFRALAHLHRLFPVRDESGRVYWYGLGRNPFDQSLTRLLEEGRAATVETLADWVTDYASKLRTPSDPTLLRARLRAYLRSNSLLFVGDASRTGEQQWRVRLQQGDFARAQALLVSRRLPSMLERLGCILGNGDYYRLPSSGNYSQGFTLSLPLLQDDTAAEQVCAWIGGAIIALVPPTVREILLVGLTAPVELFAIRLAHHLRWPKVRALNIGHFHSVDREDLLRSEEWGLPVVILSDITDSGATIAELQATVERASFSVLGAVTIFRLIDEDRPLRAFFWESPPEAETALPSFVLAELKRPQRLAPAHLENFDESHLFLVEPFSVHPFAYSSLSRRALRGQDSQSRKSTRRLALLEEAGALRVGHWVYGDHHFAFTVSLEVMVANDRLAGEVISEVIGACQRLSIDYILLPLHSQIALFYPRLQSASHLLLNKTIPTIFCISTRNITERPFYLLPKALREALRRGGFRGRPLNIMILDDAIASGRTLFTLLRALALEARRDSDLAARFCPIDRVHVYAILDRQGQAQRTVIEGIRRLGLGGDGQMDASREDDVCISLSMESWLALDIPAKTKWECVACRESLVLKNAVQMLGIRSSHPVARELEERLAVIRCRSTESRRFSSLCMRYLSRPVEILGLRAVTLELALWYFERFLRQGYPYEKLLDIYQYLREVLSDEDENDTALLVEIGRHFFLEWSGLEGQWETERWLRLFDGEIARGSLVARCLLPFAGRTLAVAHLKTPGLQLRVEKALERLVDFDFSPGRETKAQENLIYGLQMFGIYSRMFEAFEDGTLHDPRTREGSPALARIVETVRARVGERFEESPSAAEVMRLFRLVDRSDTFLARLLDVLEHTVRASGYTHRRMLALEIDELSKGRAPRTRPETFRNQLYDLAEGLSDLIKGFPPMFEEKEQTSLVCFGAVLRKLAEDCTEEVLVAPSERLRERARRVAYQFPVRPESRIFQALLRVTVPLGEILEDLHREAGQSSRVSWEVPAVVHGTAKLKDIFIVGPSRSRVQELLRNYTIEAMEGGREGGMGRVLVEVRPGTGRAGVRVAQVKVWSTIQGALHYGRGLVGAQRHDLKLFGIAVDALDDAMTGPDEFQYRGAVVLEFPIAFSPVRRRQFHE